MMRLTILVVTILQTIAAHAASTNELDLIEKARTGSFVFKCEQVLDVNYPWSTNSISTPEQNARFIHGWLAEDITGMGVSELGRQQKKEMEEVQGCLMQLYCTPPIISVTPEGYKDMIRSRLRDISKRAGYRLTSLTKGAPNHAPEDTARKLADPQR